MAQNGPEVAGAALVRVGFGPGAAGAGLRATLDGVAAGTGLVLVLGASSPADLIPPPDFAPLLARIAGWPAPVVAVLAGPLAGTGAALALAARGRVALAVAALAWPEAGVGLLPPGASLPALVRLAGAATALELGLGGRRVGAAEAAALGLVDAVAGSEAAALARAEGLARAAPPAPRPPPRPQDIPAAFAALRRARAGLATGAGAPLAPALLADCIEAALLLPAAQADAFAAEAGAGARADPAGQALRHLARAEQALSPGLTRRDDSGALTLSPGGMEAAGALRAAWVIAARALLREGRTAGEIDAAARAWGHAEGPLGSAPPPCADAGIAQRLLAALWAEAGRLVEAGRLAGPAQADALAVMATGFPRWRGGPVFAAVAAGQMVLARQMESWAQADPVWNLPGTVRAAVLAAGRWGDGPGGSRSI